MSLPSALSQPAVVAGEVEGQVEKPATQSASIKDEIPNASADSAWQPPSVYESDSASRTDESDYASSVGMSKSAPSVDGSDRASSSSGRLSTESSEDEYVPPVRSSKRSGNLSTRKQSPKRRKIGESDGDTDEQQMRAGCQGSSTGAQTKKTVPKGQVANTAFELIYTGMTLATFENIGSTAILPHVTFPDPNMINKLISSLMASGQTEAFADDIFEAARTRVCYSVQNSKCRYMARRLKTQLTWALEEVDKLTEDEEPLLSLRECNMKKFKQVEGLSRISAITKSVSEIAELAGKWKEVSEQRLADWSI